MIRINMLSIISTGGTLSYNLFSTKNFNFRKWYYSKAFLLLYGIKKFQSRCINKAKKYLFDMVNYGNLGSFGV